MKEQKILQRISIDPDIMLGKPVIKGTRLTVECIIEKIASGCTFKDLKTDYPFITSDDILAVLFFVVKTALPRQDPYGDRVSGYDPLFDSLKAAWHKSSKR